MRVLGVPAVPLGRPDICKIKEYMRYKMQQRILKIVENKTLSEGIYRMRLAGDVSAVTAPGQFINIKLKGFFLRRPISICDLGEDELTIIYKIMGRGTYELSEYEAGEELDVLVAFDRRRCGYSAPLPSCEETGFRGEEGKGSAWFQQS